MKTVHACMLIVLAIATTCGAASTTQPRTEKEKIEALITFVHDMKGAKFVRNGSEYDGPAAADHMRTKWSASSSSIKTARDFIKNAASVSSISGKPYLIRFKNGKELKSGEFLLAELERIEAPPPSTPPSTTPAAQ